MNRKQVISVIILVILIAVSGHLLFGNGKMASLVEVIQRSNKQYLCVGVLFMLGYFGLETIMLKTLINKISTGERKNSFFTALKTTLIGQYYNQITPLASGGQPMQLFVLKKANIPVGQGTVILLSKFLYFQIGVTIYAAVLTAFNITRLWNTLNHAFYFVGIGLFINISGLSFIVLMAFKPMALKKILHKVISLLSRIHIIRNPQGAIQKMDQFICEYREGIELLKSDLKNTVYMFFLTFIQLTLFFSITWLIYKALGLSGASFSHIITLQALLYMAVSFIPVPGTMGASEAGFLIILGSVFTGQLATVALLLWRGISYYFSLIFCGMYTLFTSFVDALNPRRSLEKV